jgi:hypothetical protein
MEVLLLGEEEGFDGGGVGVRHGSNIAY